MKKILIPISFFVLSLSSFYGWTQFQKTENYDKLPIPYQNLKQLKSLQNAGYEAEVYLQVTDDQKDTVILVIHRKGTDKILFAKGDNNIKRDFAEANFVLHALHDVRSNATEAWSISRVLIVLPQHVYTANLKDLLNCEGNLKNEKYRACLVRTYLSNPIQNVSDLRLNDPKKIQR